MTVSVLPAVAEEALFRGALLPALGAGAYTRPLFSSTLSRF